jgi:hypothetical protein
LTAAKLTAVSITYYSFLQLSEFYCLIPREHICIVTIAFAASFHLSSFIDRPAVIVDGIGIIVNKDAILVVKLIGAHAHAGVYQEIFGKETEAAAELRETIVDQATSKLILQVARKRHHQAIRT